MFALRPAELFRQTGRFIRQYRYLDQYAPFLASLGLFKVAGLPLFPMVMGNTYYTVSGEDAVITYEDVANINWNLVHDATGATANTTTFVENTGAQMWACLKGPYTAGKLGIARGFLPFDTNGFSGAASSGTVKLYTTAAAIDNDNDGKDYATIIGMTDAADPDNLVATDYDNCGAVDNPTKQSDDVDLGTISSSAQYTWTLNATGLGNINNSGYTEFGIREGHDIEDLGDNANLGNNMRIYTSEETGTDKDPVMTLVAAAGRVLDLTSKYW